MSLKPIQAIAVLVLLAVVFLCTGFLLFIRVGVDGDCLARLLLPRLERMLGTSISFSSANLSWRSFTGATLTITDLKCRDRSDGPIRLHVPTTVVDMRATDLLHGTVPVDRIFISKPVLFLFAQGTSNEEETPKATVQSRPFGSFFVPSVRRLEIVDAAVIAVASSQDTASPTVVLREMRVAGEKISIQGAEKLTVQGEISGEGASGSLLVTARIDSTPFSGGDWRGRLDAVMSGCPLSAVRAFATVLGGEPPFSQGIFDLNLNIDGQLRDCRLKGEARLSQAVLLPGGVFPQKVPIPHAGFKFACTVRDGVLYLDLTELALPGLHLAAEVRLGRLFTEDANLNIAVRNAEMDLEKLFALIPLNLFGQEDRERLAGSGLKGKIQIEGAAWNGRISHILTPATRLNPDALNDLVINAYLEKVSGFIPGLGLPIKNASGKIRINSDEMLFNEISLALGSSLIVLNGFVRDLRNSPEISLFLSMKALAQDLNPIFQNRVVARQLPHWLNFVEEPEGAIDAKLDIKGRLRRPSMKGVIALDGFQCRLEGQPLPLKGIKGTLEFEGAGFSFPSVTGFIGNSPFQLAGEFAPNGISLNAEAKVSFDDMQKLNFLPSGLEVAGKVPVLLKLEGKLPRQHFSLCVDLKGNRVGVGRIVRKKAGVPLAVSAVGTRSPEEIRIEDADLSIGEHRISAKGTIDHSGKVNLVFNLPPKGIQTANLVPIVDPALKLKPGGRIEGDLAVKAGPDWLRDVSLHADLALSHVSLHLPGFHKPMNGVTGKLLWRGDTVNATVETGKIGGSHLSGTMSVTGWSSPKVEMNLSSSFLDTTDFTAPPGYVSPLTWGEWIRINPMIRFFARSQGKAILKIEKGKTPKRAFSDFQATIEGNKGLLKVTGWKMNLADGTLRGNALFDIRGTTERPFLVDFQGDNLRMERFLLSDQEQVSVESALLVDGHMEWKLCSRKENNGICKTGDIEVRLRDGVIHRFDILSKIFSLINLGSILRGRLPDVVSQGLPFNRMTWEMEVFDTKWKVKNLKLLSDAAAIDASGMYFSDQDRVDFKVDVSPLVGIDKIVSGLLGNLITKDGKTLTTTFRVRGLSHSPDVRLEPLEALSSQ